MKRILIRITAAVLAFNFGIACTILWNFRVADTPILSTISGPPEFIPYNDDLDQLPCPLLEPLGRRPPSDCVDELYELTWIPTFDTPVSVVIWRSGLRAFISAKYLDVNKSTARPTDRSLTDFEWRELTRLIDRSGYWNLSSRVNETVPYDGAYWFVEGIRNKNSHWVERRVPDEDFGELSRYMIQLSGLETAHALYLPATR